MFVFNAILESPLSLCTAESHFNLRTVKPEEEEGDEDKDKKKKKTLTRLKNNGLGSGGPFCVCNSPKSLLHLKSLLVSHHL